MMAVKVKRVTPTWMTDEWGDKYLGCPACENAIVFSLIHADEIPTTCKHCGVELNWKSEIGRKIKKIRKERRQ